MNEPTNKSPRIVCAALRAANGEILVGVRHYSSDMRTQILSRSDGHLFKHRHGDDQGFVDTKGNYLTRNEAYLVAVENNQILYKVGNDENNRTLYSENLY